MTTTNTTHTAASLAAIYDRNPRELDAIAAKVIFGKQASWEYDSFIDRIEPFIAADLCPRYSASLDAAALLEKALSKRGRKAKAEYGETLLNTVPHECMFDDHGDATEGVFDVACASPVQRTIAAILTAQSQG